MGFINVCECLSPVTFSVEFGLMRAIGAFYAIFEFLCFHVSLKRKVEPTQKAITIQAGGERDRIEERKSERMRETA